MRNDNLEWISTGHGVMAAKHEMDITHILLNNFELAKISHEQGAGEWPVWGTSLHSPSFSELARLRGGHGSTVGKSAEIEPKISRAFETLCPAHLEVMTDPELV